MALLRDLINTDQDAKDIDPLDELNFERASAQVRQMPDAGDIPVKQASQDDGTDGNAVELKHGKATSDSELAWYSVVFDTPFAQGTTPTVTASVKSRGTNDSEGSFSPPSHDSPSVTALEIIGVDVGTPSLSSRSLSGRSLEDVSIPGVALSDRALDERALEQRGLPQRSLDDVSLDTSVDIIDVSLPQASLPQTSIPDVSIGEVDVADQSVPQTDVAAGVEISSITSDEIGDSIEEQLQSIEESRNSVQQALADSSQYSQFSEEDFGQGLGFEDLDFANLDDIEAIPSFEETLKRRNRETGEAIANDLSDRVNNAFGFLSFSKQWNVLGETFGFGFNFQDDIEGELKRIIDFFTAELYGAPSSDSGYTPAGGEGIYESAWGAVGAELDDIKNKFLLTGEDIDKLRDQVNSAFSDYDEKLTGSDQVEGALERFVNDLVADLRSTFTNFDNGINGVASLTDNELLNMSSAIDSNFTNTRESINTRISNLQSQVNQRFQNVNEIQDNVQTAINNLTNDINAALNDLDSAIESSINNLVSDIQTGINDSLSETESQINILSEETQVQVNDLRDSIQNTIIENNDITRDAITRLNDNVRAELQSMNDDVEVTLQNIISDADSEFKAFRDDVLSEMQAINSDIQNNNGAIEDTLQNMNSNTETTVQDMNSDIESTIQNMNQEIDSSLVSLSDDTESEMANLADDTETQVNNLSDDVEQKFNDLNENINASYENIAGLAEEALNRSSDQVFTKLGAPNDVGIAPVMIRNISNQGFQFLGYEGGMTIHWNAIGTSEEGTDIGGGGGGGREGLPGLPIVIRQ